MSRLVTRVELARIAGVSGAAITYACRAVLAPACVGPRIDLTHPAVIEYLERHGVKEPHQLSAEAVRARTAVPKKKKPGPTVPPAVRPDPEPEPETRPSTPPAVSPTQQNDTEDDAADPPAVSPDQQARGPVRVISREVRDLSEIADMTIRQIVSKFGTVTQFRDWLQALKQIEEVREKNLRNAEADGNLISIRLVQTHVMGAFERGFRRLLTDAPKTIARTLYAAAKSGVPLEEAEQMVREAISAQLRPIKDAAIRALRGSPNDDAERRSA